MFKMDLEKAEEPEIKLPTSVGLQKKQENSRPPLIKLTPEHSAWQRGSSADGDATITSRSRSSPRMGTAHFRTWISATGILHRKSSTGIIIRSVRWKWASYSVKKVENTYLNI